METRRVEAEQQAKQRELEQAKQLAAEQRQRAEGQERAARTQQRFIWGLALIAILAIAAGLYGLSQQNIATQALADSESAKQKLAQSLAGERLQRTKAESARTKAEVEKKRADEAAQTAEARLASIKAVIASIPDIKLRERLTEKHLPGTVKALTTGQQTRRENQIAKRSGQGKAQARVPAQYGLKLWANGATLRVRFIDGTPQQHETVQRIARQWTEHANLHFEYGNAQDAEIRITFDPNQGSWAYLGTDALGISESDQTMNLGIDEEGSILHEFGHVLGLIHENNNPNAKLPWNKKVVYAQMQGPPNLWSKAVVDQNLFRQEKGIEYRPFDADSIMMYAYDASWFTDRKTRGGKEVLSASDKQFVRKLYPPN